MTGVRIVWARTVFGWSLMLLLAGCAGFENVASELTGFGVGAATGAATGNPIIGVGAGLAARAAVDEGVDYYQRLETETVHDAIASVAGRGAIDKAQDWVVESDFPPISAAGQVQVSREFGNQFRCREIVFSDSEQPNDFFVAVVRKGGDGWKWAVAEPSTKRWGEPSIVLIL